MSWKALLLGLVVLLILAFTDAQTRTSAGQGSWLPISDGKLPEKAFTAGYNVNLTDIYYVCRVNSIPGRFYTPGQYCSVPLRNARLDQKSVFEVLVDFQGVWCPLFEKNPPSNAFVASYRVSNEPVYIGRSLMSDKDALVPGPINDNVLTVSWSAVSVDNFTSNYEILTSVPVHKVVGVIGSNPRYRFMGDYITFRVKAEHDVELSLVLEGGTVPIVLKFDKKKFTLTETAMIFAANMTEFISDKEYSGFWLYRSGDTMKFGVEGRLAPEYSFTFEDVPKVNMVTVTSDGRSYWYLPRYPINSD